MKIGQYFMDIQQVNICWLDYDLKILREYSNIIQGFLFEKSGLMVV